MIRATMGDRCGGRGRQITAYGGMVVELKINLIGMDLLLCRPAICYSHFTVHNMPYCDSVMKNETNRVHERNNDGISTPPLVIFKIKIRKRISYAANFESKFMIYL